MKTPRVEFSSSLFKLRNGFLGSLSALEWTKRHTLFCILLVLISAALLFLMGRSWWCPEGDFLPWTGNVQSVHNSQHLFDPYTLTHVLHGIGLYLLLYLFPGPPVSVASRLLLAVGLEASWEVLENTETIIERYRTGTIALGYYGDSILNSIGDTTACISGYILAMLIPVWGSLLSSALIEVLLLWWIRDSLLLNIVMLLWPVEALKEWQIGGF